MKFLLAFLLALPTYAIACTMALTWTPPTKRENGTPLLPAEITKYELRCANIYTTNSITRSAKPNTRGYRISSARLPAGRYSCVAITHAGNLVSKPSAPAEGDCK